MIFGVWNSEKIWHENLTDCPPHLSDVATVQGEVDKFVRYSCQIFSEFNIPKIIKIG